MLFLFVDDTFVFSCLTVRGLPGLAEPLTGTECPLAFTTTGFAAFIELLGLLTLGFTFFSVEERRLSRALMLLKSNSTTSSSSSISFTKSPFEPVILLGHRSAPDWKDWKDCDGATTTRELTFVGEAKPKGSTLARGVASPLVCIDDPELVALRNEGLPAAVIRSERGI